MEVAASYCEGVLKLLFTARSIIVQHAILVLPKTILLYKRKITSLSLCPLATLYNLLYFSEKITYFYLREYTRMLRYYV